MEINEEMVKIHTYLFFFWQFLNIFVFLLIPEINPLIYFIIH